MNRRQLFLSTARAALATAFGGSWLFKGAKAQTTAPAGSVVPPGGQIQGTAGSPDATTTIDGRYLPPPPQPFRGQIGLNAAQSTPAWPMRIVPPKGAPNILLIMTDDVGFGAPSTFGGVIPTPALNRIAANGLRYTNFHSTSLCSPTRAALITGRNHHSVGFGVVSDASTATPATTA
jgi:arylsulfatase